MAQSGYSIMGLKSSPVPWCLVSSDRPLADVEDSIYSVGFKPSDVNIVPAFGANSKSFLQIFEAIEKHHAKFVLWEGLDMMVNNPNSPGEVGQFLSRLSSYCEKGLTILGTVGVAKLKPNEVYSNPRQLVGGSSIWERSTSSNLIIQATNPFDPGDNSRLLYCTLKNEASFSVVGQFDANGVLVFDNWSARQFGAQVAALIGRKSDLDKVKTIITGRAFFAQK